MRNMDSLPMGEQPPKSDAEKSKKRWEAEMRANIESNLPSVIVDDETAAAMAAEEDAKDRKLIEEMRVIKAGADKDSAASLLAEITSPDKEVLKTDDTIEVTDDMLVEEDETEADFFKKGENISLDNADEADEIAKEATLAVSDKVRYKDKPMAERMTTQAERTNLDYEEAKLNDAREDYELTLPTREEAGKAIASLGNDSESVKYDRMNIADLERIIKSYDIDPETMHTMGFWAKRKLDLRKLVDGNLRRVLSEYETALKDADESFMDVAQGKQDDSYHANRTTRTMGRSMGGTSGPMGVGRNKK